MERKISGETMPASGIPGSRDYQNRIKYAVHILTILLAASIIVFIGLISAALLKEGVHWRQGACNGYKGGKGEEAGAHTCNSRQGNLGDLL